MITIETPIRHHAPLPDAVDVAIIGGGVIGICTALFLARAGKRVFVAEKGRIAGEQSSRNWGWIRQQGRDAAELPIMIEANRLWQELNAETGGACGVTRGGTYYLASTDTAREEHENWLTIARDHGVDTRALTRAEISTAFDGQSDSRWVGGIVTPSDLRGEPWVAVPALAQLAVNAGAILRENCAVRALDISNGTVQGIITEDGPVRADQVLLSGGAWSGLFARAHWVNIPQLAVHNTVAQTVPMPEFFTGAAADEKLALRRRQDGGFTLALGYEMHLLLGPDAFRHFVTYMPLALRSWKTLTMSPAAPKGFPDAWGTSRRWTDVSPFEQMRVLDPRPRQSSVDAMVRLMAERFPNIGKPTIQKAWAGMIDTMPDVVPVVDHAPISGLFIATGMSGHGFGIGPGFGQVIARILCGQPSGHDLRRFRFDRFTDGSKLDLGDAL